MFITIKIIYIFIYKGWFYPSWLLHVSCHLDNLLPLEATCGGVRVKLGISFTMETYRAYFVFHDGL